MDKVELIDRAAVRALAYVSSDWSHGGHPLVVEISDIDDLPTLDVQPVRRGEWKVNFITSGGVVDETCTVCGRWVERPLHRTPFNFCPNCGANMRGETHGTD